MRPGLVQDLPDRRHLLHRRGGPQPGACRATTRDGVLTSLVVDNFDEMYRRLEALGITFDCPPHYSESLQIKSMMFIGPEGYKFEVEEFLAPETRKIFYPGR